MSMATRAAAVEPAISLGSVSASLAFFSDVWRALSRSCGPLSPPSPSLPPEPAAAASARYANLRTLAAARPTRVCAPRGIEASASADDMDALAAESHATGVVAVVAVVVGVSEVFTAFAPSKEVSHGASAARGLAATTAQEEPSSPGILPAKAKGCKRQKKLLLLVKQKV